MNTNGLNNLFFNCLGRPSHFVRGGAGGLLVSDGQITQYGGYPDAGYFNALNVHLAKSYSVLTTGQYSGATNISLNGKTDAHSNNCVLDLNTGLMWSRYLAGSVGPGSDGKLPFTTNANGEGIFTFAAAANVALLAGYGNDANDLLNWRVPLMLELFSLIISQGNSGPYINTTAFPTVGNTLLYSGNTYPEIGYTSPYLVSTQSALISIYPNKTGNFPCLLVRGPL